MTARIFELNMIENLKIAVRRQKKLIIIFFLTIFLPSVSLSIFGIRAIRNERFRLAKQVENEHRRTADFLKTQIDSRFKDMETIIQNLAQNPSLSDKDNPAIIELLENRLAGNQFAEHVFIVFKDDEPWFPLFQSAPVKSFPSFAGLLKGSPRDMLKRAEDYEFKQKDYKNAISLYNQLFTLFKDKNIQAQMLNNIGRCFTKLKNYNKAIETYLKISSSYSGCTSSSGLPLALIARLQILDCLRNLEDIRNLLESSLHLYREILQEPWNLNADQFRAYSSMVSEIIDEVLAKSYTDFFTEEYKKEFEELKGLHREKRDQWQVIDDMKQVIIPEFSGKPFQSEQQKQQSFRHSKTIKNRIFLILTTTILDRSGLNPIGIMGVKINNECLLDHTISEIVEDIRFSENADIAISDLSGDILFGSKDPEAELATITEFFDDNFPPWKIEIFRAGTTILGFIDIRKSFYFWTILTLILVLTFGAILIVRTIAHEMEILKIKSDFVSSVSHELKTPLTSIKALVERLQEGKVKSTAKMEQYFSVISQDTDKLTRLVKNILDFSKIEEGKKEYDFVKTDISQWLPQQIESLRKDEIRGEGVKIHTEIPSDIPQLYIDRDALSQALINLLDNAVKFSADSKEINLNVKKDENNVVIEIRDKGIGIPHGELDKIFDKFYQEKNALKHSVKGTGLGLTLVKHIVEAHGGRVIVESKVGHGSTFSLIFPVREDVK